MLSPEQSATLKADILANPAVASFVSSGADSLIADWYNQATSPAYVVWNKYTDVNAILDAINWANLTPATSTSDTTTVYSNKALLCQGKQFNLQTIVSGRQSIDATKSNVRSGLQDALTNVPSKADGTNQSAGWVNVQTAMQRTANNLEKVFSTGTGTTASPGITTVEGTIDYNEISKVLRG